jgi:phosphoserine phosphatase RsbU/P
MSETGEHQGVGDGGALESALDLYENAPCGYLSTSMDGAIVQVNQTFATWIGHSRERLLAGMRFQDLLTAGGRIYHETHYAPLLSMQGTAREIAVELVRSDGRRLPVLLSSVVKTDPEGGALAIRTTVFDASDRREYERELLRARREEQEAHERTQQLQLENARLYEQERKVALTLQRSLLAASAPHDPRLQIASRYRPADDELEVGGDWHDAFRVAPEKIAIVVGDIVGKGIEAASAMGQLKSATRALAVAELQPAELLTRLDAFVEQIPTTQMSTLVYAVIDLRDGQLSLACAGHPPPVLIVPDGEPALVWEGRSRPLGLVVPGSPRQQTTLELEHGARLLFYTDGLIERRAENIDEGLDRLLHAVATHSSVAVDLLVDGLLDELLTAGPNRDDVCLLCTEFA